MATHTANKVKPSYNVWVIPVLINLVVGYITASLIGLTFLLLLDGIFIYMYLGRYRVTQVHVEASSLCVQETNGIGNKRNHIFTDVKNIDITYGLKAVPNDVEGLVLICYHETFREFVLFPNKNGWTEESIATLAADFEKSGYCVNNSNDPHVW